MSGATAFIIPPDDEDVKHVWINYTYDTNGNLTARSDSNGNAGFNYDALNRMTREAPEAPSAVTTYTYDAAGNVKTIQASDEPAAVRYGYDSTNLATSIIDQENRTTGFTYNNKGLRRTTTYPGGVVMENRYDDSRRLACTYAYKGTAPSTGTSKIRLISHRSFGFHSADALIALVYLCCAGITIELPR
jgi:YD repeat-containing protein